jgi:Holliday junction resolvasome RuvABC ATP-dependent DNA helicase subunit
VFFTGQTRIRNEITYLLRAAEEGTNFNILFRAPSGYGKTTLAKFTAGFVGGGINYSVATKEDVLIVTERRVQILDEIHVLESPEFLYPQMESKNWFFILCTNESGNLKEPLQNRCIQFIFDPYTPEELERMISHYLKENLNRNLFPILVNLSRGNPRILARLCERLNYILRFSNIPGTESELIQVLSVMGYNNGLNRNEEIYLNVLEKGGRMSLTLLQNLTRLDRNTIINEVEPALIELGKIRITSKGRECQY